MVVKAAKPPKTRFQKFSDPVYGTLYAVQVGGTRSDAFKRIVRAHFGREETTGNLESLDMPPDTRASFVHVQDHKIGCFWFREAPKRPEPFIASCVAHEAAHAVLYTFALSGVLMPTPKSSEAFCYYLDFLVESIWKVLWPKGK